jgi:hypothetical protein
MKLYRSVRLWSTARYGRCITTAPLVALLTGWRVMIIIALGQSSCVVVSSLIRGQLDGLERSAVGIGWGRSAFPSSDLMIRWYFSTAMRGEINRATTREKIPKTDGARPLMELPVEFPADVDYDRCIEIVQIHFMRCRSSQRALQGHPWAHRFFVRLIALAANTNVPYGHDRFLYYASLCDQLQELASKPRGTVDNGDPDSLCLDLSGVSPSLAGRSSQQRRANRTV